MVGRLRPWKGQDRFGLVRIEAMREPVVSFRHGPLPEIVADGETGLLVPPDDPVQLAEAIGWLLRDPDLCRRLRAGEPGRSWDRNVPVIMLTDPGAEPIVRVRALESGADDAVPRDVYLELLARVRALLRRSTFGQADVVEAGPLVVDHRARQVRVGEVAVRLSGREYELAAKLASDPRRVFTKTELLRDIWGIRGNGIRTRTVDSHASRLRRKLEAEGADGLVVNQWGVGYRLLA